MKYLHQWSTGKFMPLVLTAHEIAISTEMSLSLLSYLRSGEAAQIIYKHAGSADWLNLYRHSWRLKSTLRDIYGASGGSLGVEWLTRQAMHPQFSPAKTKILMEIAPPEVKQQATLLIAEIYKQAYRDNLKDYAEWLDGSHKGPELSDEMMALPEMQFFMLVFIPCLLECGMTPSRIFAKARRGDRQALLDLVRLDPSVVAHPDIKKLLGNPDLLKNADFWKQYSAVINCGVKYDPDHCRIKAQQASLLIQISQALGRKLNPKDIRQLYDALQKDVTSNPNAKDEDLPETDQGWRTEVGRSKKKWHIDLARDKKAELKSSAFLEELPLVSVEDDTGELPTWVEQAMHSPEPGKLGFCQRIRKAWRRFKLEVILETERRRRKKQMANQPSDRKPKQ